MGGLDPAAVVEVVNAEMLRALRVVSVERGHDPRDFALVAFGGAGPLHACALAEQLGIDTVLVPAAAGVLSALGLVASDERRDHVRSYVRPLAEAGELPRDGEADLRYRGQSFELTVALGERSRRPVPSSPRGALRLRATATAPSSSSPSAPRRSGRGRPSPCPPARSCVPPGRPSSSSRARPAGSPPGGWGLGMEIARSSSREREGGARDREHRASGHRQRSRGGRRGDGRGAHPLGVLLEHQGATRLLDRDLRRRRADDRPGRAHPCASRGHARGGRGGAREAPRHGRGLRRQRSVHRRHPPPRHHARIANRRRLRSVARAPCRRRGNGAVELAGRLEGAVPGRRDHSADSARRRGHPAAVRQHAQPRRAARRPAGAARRAAARRASDRRAVRQARGCTGRGGHVRALRALGADGAGGHRGAAGRDLRGGRCPRACRSSGRRRRPRNQGARERRARRDRDRFSGDIPAARRKPELPPVRHALSLLLRRAVPDGTRHSRLAAAPTRPSVSPRRRAPSSMPGRRQPSLPATPRRRAASRTSCSVRSARSSTCPHRARGR